MTTMASQITSLTVVYSTVYSDADQRKHQSSASLAFVWGIHRDRWIPRTKGQLRGKCFHLMTSSWILTDKSIISSLRHQMETFSASLEPCEGIPPVSGEFPSQSLVTQSFDVFFEVRLNKRWSKQSRRLLFETTLRRHCNVFCGTALKWMTQDFTDRWYASMI